MSWKKRIGYELVQPPGVRGHGRGVPAAGDDVAEGGGAPVHPLRPTAHFAGSRDCAGNGNARGGYEASCSASAMTTTGGDVAPLPPSPPPTTPGRCVVVVLWALYLRGPGAGATSIDANGHNLIITHLAYGSPLLAREFFLSFLCVPLLSLAIRLLEVCVFFVFLFFFREDVSRKSIWLREFCGVPLGAGRWRGEALFRWILNFSVWKWKK